MSDISGVHRVSDSSCVRGDSGVVDFHCRVSGGPCVLYKDIFSVEVTFVNV